MVLKEANKNRFKKEARQWRKNGQQKQMQAARSIYDNGTFFTVKDFWFPWLVSEDNHLFLFLWIFIFYHC